MRTRVDELFVDLKLHADNPIFVADGRAHVAFNDRYVERRGVADELVFDGAFRFTGNGRHPTIGARRPMW